MKRYVCSIIAPLLMGAPSFAKEVTNFTCKYKEPYEVKGVTKTQEITLKFALLNLGSKTQEIDYETLREAKKDPDTGEFQDVIISPEEVEKGIRSAANTLNGGDASLSYLSVKNKKTKVSRVVGVKLFGDADGFEDITVKLYENGGYKKGVVVRGGSEVEPWVAKIACEVKK